MRSKKTVNIRGSVEEINQLHEDNADTCNATYLTLLSVVSTYTITLSRMITTMKEE